MPLLGDTSRELVNRSRMRGGARPRVPLWDNLLRSPSLRVRQGFAMEPTVWKFITRHSIRPQVLLLLLTIVSFPFLYMALELPKIIINDAIDGTGFPRDFFGYELEQIPYLMVLCVIFLIMVLLNGGLKFANNVYRGTVGERMLRRLRFQLYQHVLRFPLPQFRRMSQGEIVSMITAETEPLGGYIGDSVALPAFQGGTLLTLLAFMFIQDSALGLAAVALYPVQIYLIPKLQKRVNALKAERTKRVRKLSERIGEVVGGIKEVHTHDTSQYELAEFSWRVGEIFHIRYRIYIGKFLIKFVNNFIAQVTPFFFFSIGGWLVIQGDISFGALVAVLAAYKDLSSPWKELLNFYQIKEDARIKYDLLYDSFQPPGLLEEELLSSEQDAVPELRGDFAAAGVDLREEDEGEGTFAGTINFKLTLPETVAVLGPGGGGRDRLGPVLAALRRPARGSITVAGLDLVRSAESITGRRVAYVSQEANLNSGSLRDNLLYSLKHRPAPEGPGSRTKEIREARLSGNSEHDANADWLDYSGAGVADADALQARALEVLGVADMEEDVFELGLRGTFDPARTPALASRILEARSALHQRLGHSRSGSLVELFDRDAYNANMSVAENLVFGTPRDPAFATDVLAENPYVQRVLKQTGLMDRFLSIGASVAELMLELFADVEPGSEMFERFSFISADDLPRFRTLLARCGGGVYDSLDAEDRALLVSLPFMLIPARHRMGLIDDAFRDSLLRARQVFAEGFGEGPPPVDFFDRSAFNPAVSVQDNILFGRLVYGRARSAAAVGELIREVVQELDLRRAIAGVGLDYQVGIGGARLGPAQRQKLAIGRAVMKRPDVLVVDEATAPLDRASQRRVMNNLFAEFEGRTLIWSVHHASLAEEFGHTLVVDGGRVVEQGRFADLNRPGSLVHRLVESGGVE